MLGGSAALAADVWRILLRLTGRPLHGSTVSGIVLQLKCSARVWCTTAIVKTIGLGWSENTRDILQLHAEGKLVGWDEWNWKTIVASNEVCQSGLSRDGGHGLRCARYTGHEVRLLGVSVVSRHLLLRAILSRVAV